MRSIFVALVVVLANPLLAQSAPANSGPVRGGKGWACNRGYVERQNECVPLGSATDAEVRSHLIRESITAYSGSCPCPFNTDRAGRRCGARSAYSRPGGASPLCYPRDISDEQVKEMRAKYPPVRTQSSRPPGS